MDKDIDDGYEAYIDERIRVELEKYFENLPIEGEEEGWRRIREEVYSPKRRSAVRAKRRRLTAMAIAVAALLIVFQAPPVKAWGRDFLSTQLVKLPGPVRNIVSVFIPFAPDDPSERASLEKQTKDLFSNVPFDPLVIGADAGGWSIASVGVEAKETGTRVTLEYKSESGNTVRLTEEAVLGATSSAVLYDDDDTVVTEVTIRGSAINILNHKSGQVNVWWFEQGLDLYLNGRADADTVADFIRRLVVYAGGE